MKNYKIYSIFSCNGQCGDIETIVQAKSKKKAREKYMATVRCDSYGPVEKIYAVEKL